MKQKLLLIVLALGMCSISGNAQNRELKVESDGFEWYRITRDGKEGAEDKNGRTLIPAKYRSVYYHCLNNSDGWFKVEDLENNKYNVGIYEKSGKCIFDNNRGYNLVTKVDTGGDGCWYIIEKDGKNGACDANGREIIPPIYESVIYINHEFNYKNSSGKYISTGMSLTGGGSSYASSCSSSSSSYSSSSSSSLSSSSSSSSSDAIHTGVYTHGSVGISNTGQTITVAQQLLNVEFYSDYIKVNGSIATFAGEQVLPSATTSKKFRPGTRVKVYKLDHEGMTLSLIVDSNYNMEALWASKINGNLFFVYFPVDKGNTMSSTSGGGNNGGIFGGYIGGGYTGGSSGSSGSNGSSSGNVSQPQITKTCGVCHGSGTCNNCGGRGWVTRLGGKDGPCPVCRNHDGRCSSCGGRGSWKE